MYIPLSLDSALRNLISLACLSVSSSAKCSNVNSISLSKSESEVIWYTALSGVYPAGYLKTELNKHVRRDTFTGLLVLLGVILRVTPCPGGEIVTGSDCTATFCGSRRKQMPGK